MSGFTIREMTILDYEVSYELLSITSGIRLNESDNKENIKIFLDRNPGMSFVSETGGKVIGTVLCGHDGRRGFIYHLAVDPAFRMKGVGKKLIDKAIKNLGKKGILRCHLFVVKDNELGQTFWNKTGWTKRNDILVFTKDLNQK